MCGSMCPPALAKLLGWQRAKGGQRGIRPESFLTAYEMEQLPVMLRELERANRHFWQMVCWRWSQNEQKTAAERSAKKARQQQQKQQETTSIERSPKDRPSKGCPDDSYTDGCALRELIRVMTKTMCEKGTFDVRTETMLTEFRARIVGHRNASVREAMAKESKVERRRREFMKLRTISFNGGLDEGVGVATRFGREQQDKSKNSTSTSASSSASSGYSSGEMPKDRKAKASSWLRERANSVRDRRAGRCCSCCANNDRLARLGELLNSEFHSTVFAHPSEFDVHERELKLLVWQRFTQMLVAMWVDKERFEQEETQ
uniref:Uncharacterized protein n=1 Tax=Globodera rostochiensis TaxID=31243 RepID=A0A914HRJ9_GLORO